MMTPTQRLAREAVNGIEPPASFLASPTKILFWRALAAGGRFHKHAAAAAFGWHLSSANRAINDLHNEGKVHVVGWTRNGSRGPMTKIVAFGPGVDRPQPAPLSNAFVCQRWRARNPELKLACDRASRLRRRIREGHLPKAQDALLAAIMGGAA